MKKIIFYCVVLLMSIFAFFGMSPENEFTSRLPSEFSYDVSMLEIKEDIDEFIKYKEMDIQYGSADYSDFLSTLSTTTEYKNELEGITLRYYKAYAAYYLGGVGDEAPLNRTIDGKVIENP